MLDVVLGLEECVFFLGPLVRSEVVQLKAFLDERITDGRITMSPDDDLTLDEVADFADQNNLGAGESECILLGLRRRDLSVCSDDGRARRIGEATLTPQRVLGTVDLLKLCVQQGLLTAQDAFTGYELMRA